MGTPLRVLSESYTNNTNMTGFRWFSNALDKSSLSIQRVKSIIEPDNTFQDLQATNS